MYPHIVGRAVQYAVFGVRNCLHTATFMQEGPVMQS